ncbi:hypothetical protein CSUB8523_1207 [Campylobacter subantarcticus LMG 24377]|uniref:Uncharacterized protein n=1 Tax=Campylobacter subantarcticus TaxID=497724 RepID=A0ABW9N4A8_9BACT|nr:MULTISPECIES: hypothetical protein [Campylobacter]AJC92715.1 hypothetical protein CSUB8523_1207 [Campylobacter subantarcticus LMG 24377]AJD06441.1 hypothetical protein UPTC16712_0934 [Campylobacter lari RM16712]EAL3938137.1 hypothetical protein [Campylobacter lari]MCR6540849.1 hypothetical protein [Campylobacter lari]MCV3430954.1 hypothetical protein [Campylobacter lari]
MAKQKKDSGKKYTKEEILSIKNYIDANGSFRTYEDGNQYSIIHFNNTGKERSGHALYMCAWRIENGKYNHIIN